MKTSLELADGPPLNAQLSHRRRCLELTRRSRSLERRPPPVPRACQFSIRLARLLARWQPGTRPHPLSLVDRPRRSGHSDDVQSGRLDAPPPPLLVLRRHPARGCRTLPRDLLRAPPSTRAHPVSPPRIAGRARELLIRRGGGHRAVCVRVARARHHGYAVCTFLLVLRSLFENYTVQR